MALGPRPPPQAQGRAGGPTGGGLGPLPEVSYPQQVPATLGPLAVPQVAGPGVTL